MKVGMCNARLFDHPAAGGWASYWMNLSTKWHIIRLDQ
jgi:hypothetical protein